MAKKILFEVRERGVDPSFQVIEDDNGNIQTHYGATYNSEANRRIGAQLVTDPITGAVTALLGPDGVKYLAAPIDANGNATANINLRTDTLANLLALAGGVSEIGYDPVTRTIVMFNGIATAAKPSGRGRVLAQAVAAITATTANADNATATAIPFVLAGAIFNGDGIINSADTTELLVPVGVNAISIAGNLQFAAGTGIARRIRVELWNGIVWVISSLPVTNFNNPTSTTVNASNIAQVTPGTLAMIASFGTLSPTKARITVLADAAVAVSVVGGNQLQVGMLAL